ncbi:MAG: hypothetical protein ABI886_15770 [Betaproteobacteria bacterium]
MLTPGDADPLFGQTQDDLSRDAVRALKQAIDESKEARSGDRMLKAALWALGATVVYGELLWLLNLLARAVAGRLIRLAGDTAGGLTIGGAEVVQRERATGIVAKALRLGFWAVVLLVTHEWVGFVLGRFPFTRVWGEQLNVFLVDGTIGALTAIAGSIPDLIVVVAIFVVARAVSRVIKTFFGGVQSGRVSVDWMDADSAPPTRRLVRWPSGCSRS